MSIKTLTCIEAECDDCGSMCWEESDFGCPHFVSIEVARSQLAEVHNWTITEAAQFCERCSAARECTANGHAWSDWLLGVIQPVRQILWCDDSAPQAGSAPYYIGYVDMVDGYRHAWAETDRFGRSRIRHGRSSDHPADPRCPECATPTSTVAPSAGVCPTCGPTSIEEHPRRQRVMRCTNCKEHLNRPGIPDGSPTEGDPTL